MLKSYSSPNSTPGIPFRLESMMETPAPDGATGVWYRYVITQGTNVIEGTRAGTHADVSRSLDEMIERLNIRLAMRKIKT